MCIGSFKNVPAYDPSRTCPMVNPSTSTSTNTQSTPTMSTSDGKKGSTLSEVLPVVIGIPILIIVLISPFVCYLACVR